MEKYPIKEITPESMRCGIGPCPSVYECGVGACPTIKEESNHYLVIGSKVEGEELNKLGLTEKVGDREECIRVPKELLDGIVKG